MMIKKYIIFEKRLNFNNVKYLKSGKLTSIKNRVSFMNFLRVKFRLLKLWTNVYKARRKREVYDMLEKEKEKFIYTIVGITISVKEAYISGSFLVRNVLSNFPFQYYYLIFSPNISNPIILKDRKGNRKDGLYNHNKLWYLYRKKTQASKFKFQYR